MLDVSVIKSDPKVKAVALILLVLLAVSGLLVFLFFAGEAYLDASLANRLHFIAYDEARSKVTFLVGTLFIGMLIILLEFFFRTVIKAKSKRVQTRTLKTLSFLFIISIPGSFLAGHFYDRTWYTTLENAGYQRCDNDLFSLSKGLFESAWMQDYAWCTDPKVRHLLIEKHNKKGFLEVNEYLLGRYGPV